MRLRKSEIEAPGWSQELKDRYLLALSSISRELDSQWRQELIPGTKAWPVTTPRLRHILLFLFFFLFWERFLLMKCNQLSSTRQSLLAVETRCKGGGTVMWQCADRGSSLWLHLWLTFTESSDWQTVDAQNMACSLSHGLLSTTVSSMILEELVYT